MNAFYSLMLQQATQTPAPGAPARKPAAVEIIITVMKIMVPAPRSDISAALDG